MGKKDSLLLNETQKQNLQSIIDSFDSKNNTKETTPETENEEETIEGQLPPEENDIYGFISEDT